MAIINLQPHPVNIENRLPINPSGDVARVSETLTYVGLVDGFPVMKQELSDVTVLRADKTIEPFPEEEKGVFYTVSLMVAQALPTRRDLLVPVGQVRDSGGKIVGCKGLVRV